MSRVSIENALQLWVRTALSLADGKVIWSDQGGPRPEVPCVELAFTGEDARGMPETGYTVVGEVPGEELEVMITEMKVLTLRVTYYADEATGESSAVAKLSRLGTTRALPSIQGALYAAGIGVLDISRIVYVPGIIAADFESRATLDVSVCIGDNASETTTYIETVDTDPDLEP